MGWDYTFDYKFPERKMSSIYILYELYHMKVLFYSNNSYQVLCKQHLQQFSYMEKKKLLNTTPQKKISQHYFFVMKPVYFYLSIVISIPAVTHPFKED